jgi:hypothetical protein
MGRLNFGTQQGVDMLMVGNNYGMYINAAETLRRQLDHALQAASLVENSP